MWSVNPALIVYASGAEPSRLNNWLKIDVTHDKLPNTVVFFEAIHFSEGRFDNGRIEPRREACMIGGH
jgi:hypothetical protein